MTIPAKTFTAFYAAVTACVPFTRGIRVLVKLTMVRCLRHGLIWLLVRWYERLLYASGPLDSGYIPPVVSHASSTDRQCLAKQFRCVGGSSGNEGSACTILGAVNSCVANPAF
jgi:hypothetical protein